MNNVIHGFKKISRLQDIEIINTINGKDVTIVDDSNNAVCSYLHNQEKFDSIVQLNAKKNDFLSNKVGFPILKIKSKTLTFKKPHISGVFYIVTQTVFFNTVRDDFLTPFPIIIENEFEIKCTSLLCR